MRALAIFLAGCGAATADPGLGAELRVDGAQFVPGAMSASGGPDVVAIHFSQPNLFPGAHDQPLLGELAPGTTAAAIGLEGDRGYFIVPAGPPSLDAPTEPTFSARLGIARAARLGTHTLSVRAVDASGRFGAAASLQVVLAPLALPEGKLVVHLEWSTDANLDLHVVDPSGVELWAGHPGSASAALDLDSNAQCRIDGRNQENVVWASPPAAGSYVVRVDTASLCGQLEAAWRVEVRRDGVSIGVASGLALDADTRGTHGAGDGRTALLFRL